ncbi:MAG: GNAT family N-acetyltransferase [Proteobacteria bacterium]|nr:GNAT family N-acetyltransferase [Pseudomonadota bacterium]
MTTRPLVADDAAVAAALAADVDWQFLLTVGQGFGLVAADGSLIGVAAILPYGAPQPPARFRFGRIAAVAVRPDQRRRGIGGWLVQAATTMLRERGCVPEVDAKPELRPLCLRLGFSGGPELTRRHGAATGMPSWFLSAGTRMRAVTDGDLARLGDFDQPIFGADRRAILAHVYRCGPERAFLAEWGGRVTGYVLARPVDGGLRLGPLVAKDAPVAVALLRQALDASGGQPVAIDSFDRQPELNAYLAGARFALAAPILRMQLGKTLRGDDASRLFASAGPLFG